MRPAITTLGKVVVARRGGDLVDWKAATSGNGGISIHNSTGVAVPDNSPNASQSIAATTNVADQALNLAAALQAEIPALQLEPAQEASAHDLVVQLQQSAPESESSPDKAKQLVSAVRDIAAGGAAGSALVVLAEQVATNL